MEKRGWDGRSGRGGRVENKKGGVDLDICPGALEFLVTPLLQV